MTLHDKAWLVVEDGSTKAEFELEVELEHTSELEKSYIMGERGQYLREFVNEAPFVRNIGDVGERRTGFWIDGGSGSWGITLAFETGLEDVTWGDGSGGTGASNVTATDASGADVKPLSRMNVMERWLASTLTDSRNPGRLYWGEWADGTYAASAGAMGAPMPIAIRSHNFSTDTQEPDRVAGQIQMDHITLFPGGIPDWLSGSVTDFFGEIQDSFSDITDA